MFWAIHWAFSLWLGGEIRSSLDYPYCRDSHLPRVCFHPDAVRSPLYTGMLPTLCSECVCCYRLYSQCIRVRCCHVLTAALRELGDWAGVQPFGWFD
jgi:hypothetical protein